jgi:predicted proteasome-type protease
MILIKPQSSRSDALAEVTTDQVAGTQAVVRLMTTEQQYDNILEGPQVYKVRLDVLDKVVKEKDGSAPGAEEIDAQTSVLGR